MASLFNNLDAIKSGNFEQVARKLGLGRFNKKAQARQTAEQSRGNFGNFLNELINRGRQLQTEGRLTTDDLFGDQISQLRDSAGSVANATKRALSRAIMGRGGDVSGRTGASILGVDQSTNQQLGATALQFSRLADRINRAREARGDRLFGQGLSGLSSLMGFDQDVLDMLINRDIQREQAKKQRRSNLFASFLTAAGTAATAFCWLAEELYGPEHEKTITIRSYLISNPDDEKIVDEIKAQYETQGRSWAKMARDHQPTRLAAQRMFDELYELAKAA